MAIAMGHFPQTSHMHCGPKDATSVFLEQPSQGCSIETRLQWKTTGKS